MAGFLSVHELFEDRHFDREIIVLCVRWYLRFKVSFRDLVEMMAERGLSMAHTTIMRWVQRYAPEFEKRWRRLDRALHIVEDHAEIVRSLAAGKSSRMRFGPDRSVDVKRLSRIRPTEIAVVESCHS